MMTAGAPEVQVDTPNDSDVFSQVMGFCGSYRLLRSAVT